VIDPRMNSIEYFQIQPDDGLSTTTQSAKSSKHVLQCVHINQSCLQCVIFDGHAKKKHCEHQKFCSVYSAVITSHKHVNRLLTLRELAASKTPGDSLK